MNGYSKIKSSDCIESSSIDPKDDHYVDPQIRKPDEPKTQEPKQQTELQIENQRRTNQEQEGSVNVGAMRLNRNRSVSSAYVLQTNVMRAFSMRRSSSVSERYCRIYDQNSVISWACPFEEDERAERSGDKQTEKKQQKRSKILKACKRLFGLQ